MNFRHTKYNDATSPAPLRHDPMIVSDSCSSILAFTFSINDLYFFLMGLNRGLK